MNTKPFTWSYSALSTFETCPRKYYHTKIKKDYPDLMGEAALAGVRVHKYMEDAVDGRNALPKEHANLQPIVDKVRAAPGTKLLEYKCGLTESLKPTTFFAKDVWLRCVIDYAAVTPDRARVLDWKTGKQKDDFDQLGLFAGAVLAKYPTVDVVDAGYVWLKDRAITRKTFHRKDIQEEVWQPMLTRVTRMRQSMDANEFNPRPSGLCRKYCPVRSCEFCGE